MFWNIKIFNGSDDLDFKIYKTNIVAREERYDTSELNSVWYIGKCRSQEFIHSIRRFKSGSHRKRKNWIILKSKPTRYNSKTRNIILRSWKDKSRKQTNVLFNENRLNLNRLR